MLTAVLAEGMRMKFLSSLAVLIRPNVLITVVPWALPKSEVNYGLPVKGYTSGFGGFRMHIDPDQTKTDPRCSIALT